MVPFLPSCLPHSLPDCLLGSCLLPTVFASIDLGKRLAASSLEVGVGVVGELCTGAEIGVGDIGVAGTRLLVGVEGVAGSCAAVLIGVEPVILVVVNVGDIRIIVGPGAVVVGGVRVSVRSMALLTIQGVVIAVRQISEGVAVVDAGCTGLVLSGHRYANDQGHDEQNVLRHGWIPQKRLSDFFPRVQRTLQRVR